MSRYASLVAWTALLVVGVVIVVVPSTAADGIAVDRVDKRLIAIRVASALAAALAVLAASGWALPAAVVGGVLTLAAVVAYAFFWPIWTDELITHEEWLRRMWFKAWI